MNTAIIFILLIGLMLYVTVFDVRRLMPKSINREYRLLPVPEASPA